MLEPLFNLLRAKFVGNIPIGKSRVYNRLATGPVEKTWYFFIGATCDFGNWGYWDRSSTWVHLLCNKLLVMTAEEVDSLQAVVERVGVTQAYAVQRYDPSFT